MRYYVCFDGYGHLRNAISEKELTEKYNNDPDEFSKAMCRSGPEANIERTTGHVNTLRFDSEDDLVPIHKWLFSAISASGSNFNPRNISMYFFG